jgi:outer membrane scaffolding protein for murein synthesis (MipA/OmpV family)
MTSPTSSLLVSVLALGATLAVTTAQAQVFDAVRLQGGPPGQDSGRAGAVVLLGTTYQGSDERRTLVLPAIDYQWANGWFAGVTNGIGYNFSGNRDMLYGLRLTADLGRKESRSTALRGMGDVGARAELGGFFNVALAPGVNVTSSVRYGAGLGGKGLVVDLGAGYSTAVAAQWRLGVGAGLSLVNADYMQSYFGITAAQAAASGYPTYSPEGGARTGRVNTTLTYLASARVALTAGLSTSTLLGDAADSPLVRRKTSLTGLLAAAYAF